MKLQPAQLDGRTPLSGSDGVAGTRPQATAVEQAAHAALPRQPRTGSVLARGQALNAQITGAQQALGFLNRAAEQLQGLKQAVGARLAGKSSDQAGLQRQLDEFSSSWSQRTAASGGSLDANLQLVVAREARREFRLRGLDRKALQQGGTETLTFYPAGAGKLGYPLLLEAGMPVQDMLARFNSALAGAGIRARLAADGEITFNVVEQEWPQLAEQLQLRGEGIRFPGGMAHRLRLEPQGDSIQPAQWGTEDAASLRRTLQRIVAAIAQVEESRSRVKAALARAEQMIAAARDLGDAAGLQGVAQDFQDSLHQSSSYATLSQVAPALVGISRHRVVSLLAL